MSGLSALGDLLGAVLDRGARLVGSRPMSADMVSEAVGRLMSTRGEASMVALAADILAGYDRLDAAGRRTFFGHLATTFDPVPEAVHDAATAYRDDPSPVTLAALTRVAEPPRQELLRRLNTAPGGTAALVAMRADLLHAMRETPDLARIDADFRHLLGSWFNRGFLVMRPVNWQSPAALLEKIIAYEAVHEIDTWDELRRRLQPPDRRCFAFFHPAMPDEPLIFVEVALTRGVPGSIQALLAEDRASVAPDEASVAVFYSISNCQPGLAGVSFGAFLIKQVVADLAASLPGLDTFVTLSPVPGLRRWLEAEAAAEPDGDAELVLAGAAHDDWPALGDEAQARLRRLAARYFLDARRSDGQPVDPVARFHLGNGAELMDIHWAGDRSDKGRHQSLGVMVNYHYRPDRIEANHEAFASDGRIAHSRTVRGLHR